MHLDVLDNQKTDLLIDLVALATAVPREALKTRSRGEAETARARQIAMYLSHVSYGYSLAKVGALFGRDKSTVGHAVRQIEDLRDSDQFEEWIAELETVLSVQKRLEAGRRLCPV